jgi:hypothetical protein
MSNEEKAPDIRGSKAWRQLQVWLLLEPGQYTSIRYIGQLDEIDTVRSVGRKGDFLITCACRESRHTLRAGP